MRKLIQKMPYDVLKTTAIRFSKFAGLGVISASFNLTSNFILLKYFNAPLIPTYVFIYLISILLSFVLNSIYTYQSEICLKNLISYYLIYLSAMLMGVFLLNIYDYLFDFEKWVYPFMVTPITMLWNFFNASRVLGKRKTPQKDG